MWKTLGLIFSADSGREWMSSHAALPTLLNVEGDIYRVYFSSRNKKNQNHIGSFDLDLKRPQQPFNISSAPLVSPGPMGNFDDSGVIVSCALKHDGKIYLYYSGWSNGEQKGVFTTEIGLAISAADTDTFEKYSPAPVIARSRHDPCLVASPYIVVENDIWRMWYVSGFSWSTVNSKLTPHYDIKYGESNDGIHWSRKGLTCIKQTAAEETSIARPSILRLGSKYHAWFCFDRGEGYRVGHAWSDDGLQWVRTDDGCGVLQPHGKWDSQIQAYPSVVYHNDNLYMFYNGNSFGIEGIGLAMWEDVAHDDLIGFQSHE